VISGTPRADRYRVIHRTWPFAGLAALAVVLYWPLLRDLHTRFWADTGDGPFFIWNYWSFPRYVLSFESPFTTADIFYPVGVHTAFNTNTPLWSMLAGLLRPPLGLPATSVAIGMVAVVGSGVGAYLLARQLGVSRWAAFFAGTAFMLLPWRTNRIITHLNLIHTEFLVFGIYAFVALRRFPSRGWALLLGAMVGCAFLTDYTGALLLLLALAMLAAFGWRETLRRQCLIRLGQAAGVALLLALPLLIPAVRDIRTGQFATPPGLGGADLYSTDVLSWVLPHYKHPWWGDPFADKYETVSGHERFAYAGFVVVGLAVGGAMLRDRRKWPWIGLGFSFFLLSFGPALHVNNWTGRGFSYDGFKFAVPMPYLILHQIPGFGGFRAPARFAPVASLAFIMLGALALQRFTERSSRLAVALPLAATLLTVVEFLPPTAYHTLDSRLPATYRRMAADPDPGAVLDIPLQFRNQNGPFGDSYTQPNDHTEFMYSATVHRRPMAGGTVSRAPDSRIQSLARIPVYHQILSLQGDYGPENVKPATFTAADLRELGIRFVVYHNKHPMPAVREHVEGLRLPLFAEDDLIVVWKVPDE
jgi:hypothetical protein